MPGTLRILGSVSHTTLAYNDMPKTPSSRLFDLIKSLSGSEKRYFKLAAKADGQSKYLRLFEAIEQQEVFDDVALQKKVYGKEKIQSRKYSELKAYLYDLLLRHLQQYDESTSVDYQLKRQLLGVRSLYRRLHFKDCALLLRKIKKQAKHYERFEVLLEVLGWEKQLAYARADVDYLNAELSTLLAEEQACLAELADIRVYEGLFYELYTLVRKNSLRLKETDARVAEIAIHPLLAENYAARSFKAQLLYLRTRGMVQYHQQNVPAFHDTNQQILTLMEGEPHLLREETSHYIAAISNYIISCSYNSYYDEIYKTLEKLKDIVPVTRDDEIKIHILYYNRYFSLCIRTADFALGAKVMSDYLSEKAKLVDELFERNTFYFQCFYISFANEDYDKALMLLNDWLDVPRTVEEQDLQILAKLLNLLIHYEQENYLLLESLLRATKRRLKKEEVLGNVEKLLLQTIREAIAQPDKKQRKGAFSAALMKLQRMNFSEREHALMRFFSFEAWLESKATNQKFAAVLRQYFQKRQAN